MTRSGKSRTAMVAGGLLLVIALFMLIGGLASCGDSPRKYVEDHYSSAGRRDGALIFRTKDRVAKVTRDITKKWKPADRLTDPGGVFLRYREDLIAIRPRTGGGSEISVDDADRGYAHFYPFVGGWFGTYSGRAEGFRGGGPGAGK